MKIRECSTEDAAELALMNKRLIDAEMSDNPMNETQLQERMISFLEGDYKAFFFKVENDNAGYALVKITSQPVYLRQFFIEEKYRHKGYGRKAFQMLMKHLQADEINLDVLPWNKTGWDFWKKCGFVETCVSMKYLNV